MDKKKTLLERFADNRFVHTLLSIVIGFIVGALFLIIMGLSVTQAYGKLFSSIFSSSTSPTPSMPLNTQGTMPASR